MVLNNYKIRFQGGVLLGIQALKVSQFLHHFFTRKMFHCVEIYKAKEDFQGIFQGMDSRYIRTTLSAYFMYLTTTLVCTRVLYDRVLKTKINFEITTFLNYEWGISRAGNSKSNKSNNKNLYTLVFISCFEFSRSWNSSSIIQKGGKFKINFRI